MTESPQAKNPTAPTAAAAYLAADGARRVAEHAYRDMRRGDAAANDRIDALTERVADLERRPTIRLASPVAAALIIAGGLAAICGFAVGNASAATRADLARQLMAERAQDAREDRAHRREVRRLRALAARPDRALGYSVRLAEAVYGVPASKLLAVATCESGQRAVTPGPYIGWYQFHPGTWRATPFSAFHPSDPVAASLGTAWLARKDGWGHWPVCGRRG